MIKPFDPDRAPVVLEGYVTGPRRTTQVRLALDTGSGGTLIGTSVLRTAGYDLSTVIRRTRLRSATGLAVAPVVEVRQLTIFGQARSTFPIAAHNLPEGTTYDGLLGLDFFRGLVLTLDFARGRVSLRPPRKWWQFWR